MAETKNTPQKLMDLVTPQTTGEDLVEIVNQFITPEDEKIFGDKQSASHYVAGGIAYLGAFASAPATFDQAAFNNTAAFGMSKPHANRMLEIIKRLGIIQDELSEGAGRMSVSQEVVNAARTQFLTED